MGEVFDQAEIIEALDEYKPKVLAIVHGETSTGRLQPIDQLGRACKERHLFSSRCCRNLSRYGYSCR